MNKQKGISQIFVMVIMLILAIALPITANLVKKVQDNRSSAATNCSTLGIAACASTSGCTWTGAGTLYSAGVCKSVGTMTGNQACLGKGGECQTLGGGKMPSIGTNNCTVHGVTGSIQANLCTNDYNSAYRCCVPGGSTNVTPVCTTGAKRCNANNTVDVCSDRLDGWTFSYTCTYGCESDGSCKNSCVGGAKQCSGDSVQVCISNAGGAFWQNTGSVCQYGCSAGVCKDAPICTAGAKQCSGDSVQVCISNAGGAFWQNTGSVCQYGCSAGVCKTAPAPTTAPAVPTAAPIVCTPNCACAASTLVGQTCSNGCSGTCAGVKTVPCVDDNSCAANTLIGQTCTNNCGKAVSGVKPVPVNGALGPANGTIVATKPTSAGACSAGSVAWTDDVATDGTYNWTCAGINGGTSINGSATKADCTIGNQKCITGNKYYTCTDGLWANSTTLTACSGTKVCTNNDIGTGVCKEPDYVAPKLNMFFAISGVKKINACFGDLKFKVNVNKDGVSAINREVAATVVTNSFNKNGDQVFKISDFALDNSYALTDKMKISIGGKKSLATIYGKDNQVSGFPALNTSNILVSNLVDKTLTFYDYPVLNGDIGAQGALGTQDNVVNGIDFAFMKNEWGKTCNAGENLVADLNGDCRVDTFDLQILKNAMGEQYAQKTD